MSERTYPPKYPQGFILETLRRIVYPSAAAVVMQTEQGLAWLKNMTVLYCMDKGFRASQTYDLSFDLSVADMFFTFSNHSFVWVNTGNLRIFICVI